MISFVFKGFNLATIPYLSAIQVRTIFQLHQQAFELLTKHRIHLVSTDEMTGIQALERSHSTKAMRPGKVERQEFEYIRHATQSGKCELARCQRAGDSSLDGSDSLRSMISLTILPTRLKRLCCKNF